MADMMLVRPAQGLLVPYVPHRPGQYIGVRRAPAGTAPEQLWASVPGGHSYVAGDPARVPVTPHYTRAVQRKELELVDEEAWQAELSAREAAAEAEEPVIVAGDPETEESAS